MTTTKQKFTIVVVGNSDSNLRCFRYAAKILKSSAAISALTVWISNLK